MTLLSIETLSVDFAGRGETLRAVHEVSFSLKAGETLGVVGESGCGKSQTLLAALGLLPANGRVQGSARYRGEELIGLAPRALNRIRGRRIGMVFQDPMSALTPHLWIETQMLETLRAHETIGLASARRRALDMLEAVQIGDAERVLRSYPHELSGGMRQRVMIAMALLCGPDLLIADEPTTALDVTVQAQILTLLKDLKERLGLALILVSHDLGVVAGVANRVLVMYAGRIIEEAEAGALFKAPKHPYTRALLASIPSLDGPVLDRLPAIPGQPPQPGEPIPACAFAARCPQVFDPCDTIRPVLSGETHQVACHLYSQASSDTPRNKQ